MPSLDEFIATTVTNAQLAPIVLTEPVPLEALHTPALIIDLDVFEENLNRMQAHLTAHNMGLRCHTKMHKCPIVAREQIRRGALGVCAATVSEAEIMLAGGVTSILITSPVVTPEKINRIIALGEQSEGVSVVVDHIESANQFDAAARAAGIVLPVLVDLDPGMGRTGIATGDPAIALVHHIGSHCTNLRFTGLQMYAGNCMHIEDYAARRDKYLHLMDKGRATRDRLTSEGVAIDIFTGGGTGTYDIEPELGLLTDLQAGSYAFMDLEYRDIGSRTGERFDDFAPSLFVLVTAISKPQERLVTVDAGFKSLASDKGAPEFRDLEGVVYHWGGDEHGIIALNNPSRDIRLGDKLQVITPHCDPTVNLFDYYFPHRNGMVSEIWPIAARGRSQ